MSKKSDTAWFGSSHAAAGRPCPARGAHINKPCVSRVGMPGTCVGEGCTITGMHAERLTFAAGGAVS